MKKMHMSILYFILSIIIVCLIYFSFTNILIKTDEFIGTYICEENIKCSFIVDLENNNTFYLLDYDNKVFIKGNFKENLDKPKSYSLSSNEEIIENQSIICKDLKFKIKINNNELIFKKINQTPILPYNLNELITVSN